MESERIQTLMEQKQQKQEKRKYHLVEINSQKRTREIQKNSLLITIDIQIPPPPINTDIFQQPDNDRQKQKRDNPSKLIEKIRKKKKTLKQKRFLAKSKNEIQQKQNFQRQRTKKIKKTKKEKNKQYYQQKKQRSQRRKQKQKQKQRQRQSQKQIYLRHQKTNRMHQQRSQTAQIRKDPTRRYYNYYIKYVKQSKEIVEDGLEGDIKSLKMLFYLSQLVKGYKYNLQNIRVKCCTQYPVIFIQYDYVGQKRYLSLRKLIKDQRQKLKDLYQIIYSIYKRNYSYVDFPFQQLDVFAFLKAKAKGIRLFRKYKGSTQNKPKFQNLFYYVINKQGNINFIFYDAYLKDVEFNETFIMQKIQMRLRQSQMFRKFQKIVKGEVDEDFVDIGHQQVEGNEQNYKNRAPLKSIGLVRRKQNQLKDKDLIELKDKIQQKNDQFNKLQQSAGNANVDNELVKIGNQIEKLQRNLQNFELSKNKVQKSLQQNQKDKSQDRKEDVQRMCLKKMIIAAKQLDKKLPILAKKREILEMLKTRNLVILEGETGSGKSTQLPQILCEFYKLFDDPKSLKVLVTQPRRLAIRSLAERLAEEMEEAGGNFIDYVDTDFRQANKKAKIIFKLDRLVLDEMIDDSLLQNYSCLLIDEAHQRTISIDLILGLVKKILQKRKDFKVIVTSASMDIKLFENYFNVKALKVSGQLFPVDIKYMSSSEKDVVKKIQNCIDNELLQNNYTLKPQYRGHVLVFCSGVGQIMRLCEIFEKRLDKHSFKVLPLHGKVNPQQQKKIFQKTKEFKIIFASRIAQTAITIDGIKVVIDSGLDRQLIYDQKNKFSSMKLLDISQSSAKQRAGRAGRTQQGTCFRLYSQHQLGKRRFNKLPEIKNIALDSLVLRLKSLRIEDVLKFSYIDAPDTEGIKTSIQTLKIIGCLKENEQITTIGQFLIKLPVEPFLARAIVESRLMEETLQADPTIKNRNHKIVEKVVDIIVMISNAANIFRVPQKQREYADKIKYKNFSHEKGDFFFFQRILSQFKEMQYNKKSSETWIRQNYLNIKTLLRAQNLGKQINIIIKNFTINKGDLIQKMLSCKVILKKKENLQDRILACLSTSFCANICLYSGNPYIGYTYIAKQRPVQLYGSSSLSLQGICPKWIVCYDFSQNQQGKLFCKVANEITFQLLQDTVDDYVFKIFKIAEVQKNNPFYREEIYNLPTLLVKQIKNKHMIQQYHEELKYMEKLNLSFHDDANKVITYILCTKKQENGETSEQTEFKGLVKKLKQDAKKNLQYNYRGSTYITFEDGFQISKIEIKSIEKLFEITNPSFKTYYELTNDWRQNQNIKIESYSQDKIKIYIRGPDEIRHLQLYLEYLKTIPENQKMKIKLCQQKSKNPRAEIILQFFAGNGDKDNSIFICYKTIVTESMNNKQYYNPSNTMLKYIQQAIKRQSLEQEGKRKISPIIKNNRIRMTLSKNKNGINCISQMDQIEFSKFIQDLIQKGHMNPEFQLPFYITRYRNPDGIESLNTDKVWIENIQKLIESVGKKRENQVNVWKPYKSSQSKLKLSSEQQINQSFYMKAQIKTFDLTLFQQLRRKYQGQSKIIGCQKLHLQCMYNQVIARVSYEIYESLQDEFDYLRQCFLLDYPSIIFDQITQKRGNQTNIMIRCRSENRQHLLSPYRKIKSLFTPHIISLKDSDFSFLNGEQGSSLIQDMKCQYNFKIYLDFDKINKNIKLYSRPYIVEQIKQKLKLKLKSCIYTERVSYRGKNLKKIEQILKKYCAELKNDKIKGKEKYLQFDFFFGNSEISITTDYETLNIVKKDIQKLINIEKQQCNICLYLMNSPYKLYNCEDAFCQFCLTTYLRSCISNLTKDIKCPRGECNQLINIHDIKEILSEQFQSKSDIIILEFVKISKDYILCSGIGCKQIFKKQIVKKGGMIDCELCCKNFCFKCKIPHRNFTCEQWQIHKNQKQITKQDLAQLEIQQCPKCGFGLQRIDGCNHVVCRCKSHICWMCLKTYKSKTECYNHLDQVCGRYTIKKFTK